MRGDKRIRTKKEMTFQDVMEKSRHEKLWINANYVSSGLILVFLLVAVLNIIADIRGDYRTYIHGLGMVRLSIRHSEGKLYCDLAMPRENTVSTETTDKDVGQTVEWQFKDTDHPDAKTDITFKGKVEPGTISGVVQDGDTPYNVTLERDLLASILHSVKGLVPGASD